MRPIDNHYYDWPSSYCDAVKRYQDVANLVPHDEKVAEPQFEFSLEDDNYWYLHDNQKSIAIVHKKTHRVELVH